MRYEWLLEHRKTEANYWWFVNKRRLVYDALARFPPPGRRLVEAGTGGGYLAGELERAGWQVLAGDLWPQAAAFAREQGAGGGVAFDAGRAWPLRDETADAVIMLDTLEHLPDDVLTLREVRRVLRPRGIAVVSVPAYQWLFSAWDTYNAHYRRYTARALAHAAREAGLSVRMATYWNLVSLPPAILLRGLDRVRGAKIDSAEYPPVAPWVNRALRAWGRAEAAWARRCPIPAGLSALAVLERVDLCAVLGSVPNVRLAGPFALPATLAVPEEGA